MSEQPNSGIRAALPLPNGRVGILGFRVAEEPGRIPVDVRCLCGQAVCFRRIFVLATDTAWAEASHEGLCPACRRPLRVVVRVMIEATVIGRPEPPADAEAGDG